jgi:PST family polysaccharide transporter
MSKPLAVAEDTVKVLANPVRAGDTGGPVETAGSSYGQIFKSTALVGGSSAIKIALRIIRTKVIAVMLGPAGMGLFGLFNSIADLSRTVSELGINQSGVRQIAEANGGDDACRIALVVTTLRRVALLFGCAGAVVLAVLCKPVARLTFGNEHYAGAVLLLSLTVLFGTVSEAQTALIQGMRRIGDLARLSILGGIFGTLFSIPLVYFFRERGVVYSIVCVAGMGVVTSWWYARKVKVERVPMSYNQVYGEAAGLLKLGLVLMLCSIMPLAVAYAVRIIVQHKFGLAAAGYYQAAWALGVLYINFILQAMGMDFYPRLTAASKDNTKCNRMMNEQTEVGLLLAGPGVLGTLTVAPLVIHLFYSAKFGPAVELLRWNCLGMIFQVVSWPIATLQLAKGRGKLFFCTEFSTGALNVLLTWIGVKLWGLNGTAIAFCGMITVHYLISYGVARRLSGFHLSPINLRLGLLFVTLITAVFVIWYALSFFAATALGVVVTMVTGVYSLRLLCALMPVEKMPGPARKVIGFFRPASPEPED